MAWQRGRVIMHNDNTEIALTYHEETKHSYDSVYRTSHYLDWENQPLPFKLYTGLEAVPLPSTLPVSHVPTWQALAPGAPHRPVTALPTPDDLAYMLFYAAGVTKRRLFPGHGEMLFRAAACTGALYHIELYAIVADLPGLSAGVYHFAPKDFALRQLRPGDYRQYVVEASGYAPGVQEAPVLLIGTDTFWRNAWKYRARAYRHSFWDAGTILANALAAANALALPARLVTGFVDERVNTLLALDTDREVSLFVLALGQNAPPAARLPSLEPLQLEVAPLSRQEADYPAIRIMHQAANLDNPEEVIAWRATAYEAVCAPATATVLPLQPDTPDAMPPAALEDVIRRRGSTRRFAHRALSLTQLSNVLVHTTQDIPSDFSPAPGTRLNDLYLIVHAVNDLPSGAYVYHPQTQAFELLEAGDFRHQAGMLALGQDLAADASVNVYCLCDLALLLAHFGNRGYRLAQLEAGIFAGRMYLGAYAQGFGATGLTFFDDDVTDFFSPHAAGKSVMFLLAMGYAAPR